MLEIQKILRDGSYTVETLAERGVKAKEHPEFPGLWHFCYDQIEAKPTDPIVREARGLILNANLDWDVVAAPFFRFANHGEGWADDIDWRDAVVQEKVDGSLMILWNYAGKWHVSTKGSPNAGGQVGVHPFTFKELFWRVWKDKGYCTSYLHPNRTYMCELVSPFNRVVCEYNEPGLILLGAREIYTLKEESASHWSADNFAHLPPPVKQYDLGSVDAVIAAANLLTPESGEGFVVRDSSFRRVKIKSPAYVLIHHAKDGFGQRRIIDLIRIGETSEVLAYFPEYQQEYDQILAKMNALIVELEADYDRLKHIEDQKAFALEAVKTKYSAALFQVRSGRSATIGQAVRNASTEALERLLGIKKTNVIMMDEPSS